MAKRAKAKPAITGTRPSACQIMAHDMQRLAATMADIARGYTGGGVFGPRHNSKIIEIRHSKGPKSTYERCFVEPGTNAKTDCTSVGNEYGVARQLSRDIARLWGCKTLQPERGFEGAGPRKRKR